MAHQEYHICPLGGSARNVGDPGLADEFRRSARAEVLRTAGWK
jgi:hypothetical protein